MHKIPSPPACAIKGHSHALMHVRRIVQEGTGKVAHIWECSAGGRYRWFCLEGHEVSLSNLTLSIRPRHGWKR